MKRTSSILSAILAVILLVPSGVFADTVATTADYRAYFVYTNNGVTAYEATTNDGCSDKVIASTDPATKALAPKEADGITIVTSGNGFVLSGNTVRITAGTKGHICQYFFKGSCDNGSIFVEKDGSDEIELELQGLTLTEPDEGSCPIWVKGGDTRVTLKAKKGTENILTDAKHVDADGEVISPKACVNASKKIKIGGKGTLTVNGNNKNGIKSDTKIEIGSSITLNVNAADNAISADKELCVASDFSGTINIESQGKGLCGTFDKDELPAGEIWEEYDNVLIQGGTINIDAVDDAVHSNREIVITGGTLNIKSQDDGIHADEHIAIGTKGSKSGPAINITKCFEGIESLVVDIYGGDIDIIADDDGVNAANRETKLAIPDKKTRKAAPPEDCCNINVYGGDFYILSGKDGLDSNGNITISGGNLLIFASSHKATQTSDALDAGINLTIVDNGADGATIFGASPTGRMQCVPTCNGQKYVMGTLECATGDKVRVEDNGLTKDYTMDCLDGFIFYTSPTYTNGSINNVTANAELTPNTSEASHNYVAVKTVKAGYTKNGYTIYKCSRCGDTYKFKFSKSYVKNFKIKGNATSIKASWTKQSRNIRRKFTKYQIRYSLSKDMDRAVSLDVGKNKSGVTIKNLMENAEYYVQIRTYSRGCWSKWTTRTVTTN